MAPEARIHLETPSPPCCAACYQAVPEKRHVDFGASTDGPVTNVLSPDRVGVVGHVIDEIIICETCITEAAKLLGLGDAVELLAQVEQLEATIDTLHEQAGATRQGIADALETVKTAALNSTAPPNGNSLIPGGIPPVPKPRAKPTARAAARKRTAR